MTTYDNLIKKLNYAVCTDTTKIDNLAWTSTEKLDKARKDFEFSVNLYGLILPFLARENLERINKIK